MIFKLLNTLSRRDSEAGNPIIEVEIRVYAQPYYVLRQAKYYVEGKKGVCATYYVLRKLKKDKVTNRCNIICSLLNRNLSVVDDNLKRNKQI